MLSSITSFIKKSCARQRSTGSIMTLEKLAALLSKAQSDVFVLQIGAMDGVRFDPIHELIKKYHWTCLLVEPLPDIYEQLVRNYANIPGIKFENCAIADHDGTVDMYRIPLQAIAEGVIPEWGVGVSSMYNDRNALGGIQVSDEQYRQIKQQTKRETVQSLTLASLLKKHQISHVDVLQIDTEGSDYQILSQVNWEEMRPQIVHVEYYNLPREEQMGVFYMLGRQSYTIRADHKDVLATGLL